MKGLLVKDFFLLHQRKQTILMFLIISLVMGFSMDGSFIVGYMCLLSTTLAVGTVSYDDADNGLLFLMSCPVTRRDYVLSKYVLCGIVLAASWIISIVFLFALNLAKGIPLMPGEAIAEALVFLPGILLTFCLMIPVQLKYGPENGRLVILLLMGGLAAVLLLVSRGVGDMTSMLQKLDAIPDPVWAAVGAVLCILMLLVSMGISSKIMEKKVF